MDFLVKHSYGYMRHFFHSVNSGICFCSMRDAHVTNYEVLIPAGQMSLRQVCDVLPRPPTGHSILWQCFLPLPQPFSGCPLQYLSCSLPLPKVR